jgi:acyl carrier protein phosphodiesterase
MNFLFHMYLSGDDPELLAGNFMGDFVKGSLGDAWPPGIRQGLLLHRKIDSFAQKDQWFQASRSRLSPNYGLFRGVLVDLFYDHFLARGWRQWSSQEFPEYISWARTRIEERQEIMPSRLQALVPYIFDELLPSYGTVEGIGAALARMSRRINRPGSLSGGEAELVRHYGELKTDFDSFLRNARQFAAGFIAEEGGGVT